VCNIPYDWIFPKVYAVMHHGGSGTTHLGLKFGCATLIIPHILDQHVWNKIVYDLGAGPLGIKIGKIAKENIEPKILILMNDSRFREKARQIQKRMSKEDFREELYNFIVK
jgi:UDP:flavonoid glycosyltransferase YjiC (YdhE family)